VRRDVLEPGADVRPQVELVGTPVRGQRRVEGVGDQLRFAGAFGVLDRLVGQLRGPRGVSAIRPAARQRRRHPRPGTIVEGVDEHVVELGREPTGLGAEDVPRCRVENRLGPRRQLVVRRAHTSG